MIIITFVIGLEVNMKLDKKNNFTILESSTIGEGLLKIDKNKIGMVFITDIEERVIGVSSDGDIRSGLLNNRKLSDSLKTVYNSNFVWEKDTADRESILKLLDSKIKVIPILNSEKRLVEVITKEDFPIVIERNIFARSKAPVRVGFAGGGSDLTHYFMDELGAVLNATITLYCHASLRPRDDKKISIDSFDLAEKINFIDLDDLVSTSDNFDLVRSVLKLIKPEFGFELAITSDFPFGSGLGGSAAVMVAILGCFNEFRKDKWNDYEIAEIAFQAERLYMGVAGGWQDQYAAVFGGFNFIEFKQDNNLIHPLRLREKTILELQENLFLFEVSSGRNSGNIHDDQKTTMKSSKVLDLVQKNVNLCYNMRENLLRHKLTEFGSDLNRNWQLKRQFGAKISNNNIDEVYEYAIKHGALGGKLLGAGGGGFFIFYVEPANQNSFLGAMRNKGFERTVFNFDHDGMKSWTNREVTKAN
tara:strand:+ start:2621 stop:4042 length:1422 start_codon:yes stop_codon:yes gene_type:complete